VAQTADVCVTGLGQIGWPLAVLAAATGLHISGADQDLTVLERRAQRGDRGSEPGLQDIAGRLPPDAIRFYAHPTVAALHVVCVPSPLTADRRADLAPLRQAIRDVAPVLRPDDLVVIETTVPVGTTDGMVRATLAEETGIAPEALRVAYCPERLLPGNALAELRDNARVIGAGTERDRQQAAAFYRRFVRGPVIETDTATAEFVKLAENTYRDVNIAIANMLLRIASASGIDGAAAIGIANLHPRVEILQPGPGVGGHCLTTDPHFLAEAAAEGDMALILAARAINDAMPEFVAQEIDALLGRPATVVILGTAYKPNVTDERESPALAVAERLRLRGHEARLHDPVVGRGGAIEDVLDGVDAVALLVAHDAYAGLAAAIENAAPGVPVYYATGAITRIAPALASRATTLGTRLPAHVGS